MFLDSLSSKFSIRFKDRTSAAILLSKILQDTLKKLKKSHMQNNPSEKPFESDILIIGIPRGGVIIADVISKKLSYETDIVIPRKLGAPHNKELAIGAVVEDGTLYLNQVIIDNLAITKDYIEQEKREQIEEIKRRNSIYRQTEPRELANRIKGKIIMLVDDGIATGATIIAAARWIKKYQPKYLIIAAPVATKETVGLLTAEADEVEVITTPPNDKFQAVAQFYQNFSPIEDEQVKEILSTGGTKN
jgi:putative phosphoribosyl transferase